MNYVKKALTTIGGIFLAALLITALAPKAAHGIVAALVQVSNPVNAPAITQSVPQLASQIVELYCPITGSLVCYGVAPGGQYYGSSYAVPSGETLVITEVEVTGMGGGGTGDVTLVGFNLDYTWGFPRDGEAHEYQLSPGILYPAGATLTPEGTTGASFFVRGYLTPQ
jgi:hypothetical protein